MSEAVEKHNSLMHDLVTREEPLCDELKWFVTDGGSIGEMIHHPLVIEMFYDPKHSALINYRYRHKVEERNKAMQEGKWEKYIFIHERPYRIGALRKAMSMSKDRTKMHKLVANVWIDSENIWQHKGDWASIWTKLPDPRLTMDANERTVYDWMPDMVEIHRGIRHTMHNRKGMSWTRDKERASWFAVRWRDKKLVPQVLTTTVKKEHILAFFMGRGEEEVVIQPKHLGAITSFNVG